MLTFTTLMGGYRKLEGYQLARMLLAAVCAGTPDSQGDDPRAQLRHAILAALLQLVELETRSGRVEHERCLQRALTALEEAADLILACRRQGALSDDAASELLSMQARTASALEGLGS